MRQILRDNSKPKAPGTPKRKLAPRVKPTEFLFGWKPRFVIAAILIACGAFWVRTELKTRVNLAKLEQNTEVVAESESTKAAQAAAKQAAGSLKVLLNREGKAIVPGLEKAIPYVDCLNTLVAGLILLPSIFSRKFLAIVLYMAGSGVALVLHHLDIVPEVGPLQPHQLTMIVGLGLGIAGFVVSRSRGRVKASDI